MSCCRIDEALANPFYDGSLDHDTSRWLNDDYLSTCFDEFNIRFFQGMLNKPILHCCSKTEEDFEDGLGVTVYDFVDCFGTPCDEVDLRSIKQGDVFRYVRGVFLRNDVKWSSRFQFENTLIHEMCHVYQNDIVLERDLYAIIKDSETSLRRNQKDRFHGDAFLGIAKKVSNHPENEEWFEVTPYVLGDEIIREFRMFRDTNDIEKTHRDSRRHYEVTSRDIPNLSDRRSNARSRSSNIVARYQSFDKEKGEIRYNVTSQTKAGKSYTVSFRFKNWHPDMNHLDDEIQHSMKGDIEIDCTCPAFEFQGYKYLATLKGGSIEAERRPPDKTNRDRHGFACKHILKAIDSFNQDFDKFRSEGKGLIRKRNLRVQHKYESKHICKKASWFVIDDGTFDLPIVTEDNLMSAMDEVVLDLSAYALEQTEQSIVNNRITDDFVWNIIRHHNHEHMSAKSDMWITVYAVTDDVIDRWNRYGTDTIDTDNPTAYQIRKVLFCDKDSGAYGLLDLLRSTTPVLHKYIPALVLNNNQSILGRLDILTEKLSLEYNHD